MNNLEFDFDESEKTIENKIEPYLKQFIEDSGTVEKELKINPYLRLKSGIKKDNATEDDYNNIGLAANCYKSIWFRLITVMKEVYRFQLRVSDYQLRKKIISELPEKYEYKIEQQYYLSFNIDKDDNTLIQFLNDIKKPMIESYIWACEHEKVPLVYGCCSLYAECSNAKKCLQESIDVKYAKGCEYRKSLKENRIFYGKNRNI